MYNQHYYDSYFDDKISFEPFICSVDEFRSRYYAPYNLTDMYWVEDSSLEPSLEAGAVYGVYLNIDEPTLIGFIVLGGTYACYANESFVQLELCMIEVFPQFRDKGLGTKIVNAIFNQFSTDDKYIVSLSLSAYKTSCPFWLSIGADLGDDECSDYPLPFNTALSQCYDGIVFTLNRDKFIAHLRKVEEFDRV